MVHTEEELLAIARRKLQVLKCNKQVNNHPYQQVCQNLARKIYSELGQPFESDESLRKLPEQIHPLVLEEVEKIVCADEKRNEKTLNAILSVLHLLLSPKTKSFRIGWLTSCSRPDTIDFCQLRVINILAASAPNLKSLTLDDSSGVKPLSRFPLITKEIISAILQIKTLKSLSTGRLFIVDNHLIKICKKLNLLHCLQANIIFKEKSRLSKLVKTMRDNLRHLKDFRFDRIAVKDGKELKDDYQVFPKELVKCCLEHIPRLQIVKSLVTDPKSQAMNFLDSIKGPSNLCHVHLSHGPSLKSLILLPRVTHFKMTWDSSPSFIPRKFLSIQSQFSSTNRSPMPVFPNVEYLHLEGLSLSLNLLQFAIQYGKTLHTLIVDARAGANLIVNLTDLSIHCPNVQSLHLGGIELSADSTINSFPRLKDLKLILLNRNAVKLSNLLAVPALVNVDIKVIRFDIKDVITMSSKIQAGNVLMSLEAFRLECMPYDTIKIDEFAAISNLVKLACAFLPNMRAIQLDVTFFPPLPNTPEKDSNGPIPASFRKKAAIFEALGDRNLILFLIEFGMSSKNYWNCDT
ncbi:Hypothetical predicted protein [Cloeon dipterum]|uniref:Uncharacterized protein n=1 Tax=Cloeon dipterum TaxID=197152 RepID=A0A8S1DXH6_9INSE|nr:Hypothetical predicted protein [Cloeon dipterum]